MLVGSSQTVGRDRQPIAKLGDFRSELWFGGSLVAARVRALGRGLPACDVARVAARDPATSSRAALGGGSRSRFVAS